MRRRRSGGGSAYEKIERVTSELDWSVATVLPLAGWASEQIPHWRGALMLPL